MVRLAGGGRYAFPYIWLRDADPAEFRPLTEVTQVEDKALVLD